MVLPYCSISSIASHDVGVNIFDDFIRIYDCEERQKSMEIKNSSKILWNFFPGMLETTENSIISLFYQFITELLPSHTYKYTHTYTFS